MEVKNRLSILMAERNIRSIAELQRMLEDIGRPVARRTLDRFYKNENNQIHYDTIADLCMVLNCDIGDLFVLEKSE
ncbi:helix-turn-helix transcriptional regulator [Bacillus sp. FSL K6-6483]|uniref:Transcriptional regulator n=1 Tax=Shouchella clausii (strain KSM-K16) TaxID=66692 RepID=Q5WE19_SHOC1|nr:helix-turn-helix transcriptional regulator [Shouchella clausii]MBU8598466.1 helix-turn-helix transcriptional regulator [Shouchella clausii]BAD65391.1 transcriptional regulator [Shouchella clausii KSM-K16]